MTNPYRDRTLAELDPHRVPDIVDGGRGYVAGFCLDDTGRVALVRKTRPAWQAGRLNAVGGKIEPGETPHAAMVREFAEEAGLTLGDWEHLACLTFPAGVVWFFRHRTATAVLDGVRSCTDETIETHAVADILDRFAHADADDPSWCVHQTLPNLSWLLPLAAYTHDRYTPLLVHEDNT